MTSHGSMESPATPDVSAPWQTAVARYQTPTLGRSMWQIVNSIGAYVLLWYLMYLSLAVSAWLTAALALLTAGILIRVFIIFHDCGHGSFFASRRANDVMGFITGVLTFTPYQHWRWEHAVHHATSSDLDDRGIGDVWTMTVDEYLAAARGKRFVYRLWRNPVMLLGVTPLALFVIKQRFPSGGAGRRERRSVHWTNLALLGLVGGLVLAFGWKTYLLLQLAILGVGGAAGVWLFYVQHQFEGVYWERGKDWDYATAALRGSSFYQLPRILQWFSGNIGFHHIHHLSPRIPNYHLESCHRADPLFQTVKPVTLGSSLRSLGFRLWDERQRQLVGFGHLRELRKRHRSIPDHRVTEPCRPGR